MKQVALILSGCGVYDGSEIHETVLTLLALAKAGAAVKCFAPNKPQHHVVDHQTGEPLAGKERNVLRESARIARGEIEDLNAFKASDFDAVILPGGFGAAKNLCTLAFEGADYEVDPDVAAALQNAHREGKATGVMCIAPAVAAAALGEHGPKLTIGNDAGTAAALGGKGAVMVETSVTEIVIDERLKLVSTPAYMLADNLVDLERGINKLVAAVLDLSN